MTEPGKTILTSFPLSATSELIADRISAEAYRRSVHYVALVLSAAVLGLAVGLIVAWLEPAVFEADAIVEMVLHAPPRTTRDRIGKTGLAREAQLLMSPPFLNEAFATLSPELRARLSKRRKSEARLDAARPDEARMGEGQRALSKFRASAIRQTSLLRLSYRSSDPELAIDVVNGLIPAAQLAAPKLKDRQIGITKVFLMDRLQKLAARIAQEDNALDEAGRGGGGTQQSIKVAPGQLRASTMRTLRRRRRKKARGFGSDTPGATLELQDDEADPALMLLNREANKADDTQRHALARLKALETMSAAGNTDALESMARAESVESDPYGIKALRMQLGKTQADYAALSVELGPEQPQIKEATARLQELNEQLDDFHRVYLEAARKQEQAATEDRKQVKKAFHEQQTEAAKLAEQEDEHVILELELGIDLSIYQNLHDLLKVRSTYAGMEAPTLDVVDLATEPATQERRPYAQDALLFSTGFTFLGGLSALTLYLRRRNLWTVGQAERAAFMPLMAALPTQTQGSEALAGVSEDAAYRDAIRELGDAMVSLHDFSSVRVILLAEVAPQMETSELGAGLAVDLAGTGAKVLLMDADLVRPSAGQRFRLTDTPGLCEVLSGHRLLDEAMVTVPGIAGLWVLPAGRRPPVTSTLLQSGEMKDVLRAVSKRFDYVVILGPPVLASSDSGFLADRVDLLLLVARFAKLQLKLIQLAGKALYGTQMPLAGLIIEGTPPLAGDRY